VGYQVTSVFKEWDGQNAVKDPIIIKWCGDNNHVWVDADDSAKKNHAKEIVAIQIRTLRNLSTLMRQFVVGIREAFSALHQVSPRLASAAC
jgi:hypothetical protein